MVSRICYRKEKLELLSIDDLFLNYPLVSAVSASLISQAVKVILASIKTKTLNLGRFVQTGGMPSSHSAMAIALVTAVALQEGPRSVYFAICIPFALVVLYDAGGVRRAAGMQAQMINQIKNILESKDVKNNNNDDKLKELIGHTPMEVLGGSIIGIVIAIIFGMYYV